MMSTSPNAETIPSGGYADLSSPTDSVIAGDFGQMSAEEQEKQREEWKQELTKTEEEISTLRQVLHSKEIHAAGLKRRLGITAWREFSEDMAQGLKSVQDSDVYKRTAEGINVARERTAGMWSQMTNTVANSQSFQNVSGKVGSALGAAKNKISASMSTQTVGEVHPDGGAAHTADGAADTAAPAAEANGSKEEKVEKKK